MNKNKTVITVLTLIIIVLLVFIYLLATQKINLEIKSSTYDPSYENNNTNDNEIIENNNTDDYDIITKLIGNYSYKGEYVDVEKNKSGNPEDEPYAGYYDNAYADGKMHEETLKLNSSGTAEALVQVVRGGGSSAKGKWYISNNEIIILNEECITQMKNEDTLLQNCIPVWRYTYNFDNNNNNNVVIESQNYSSLTSTLNKVKN